jgi:membrane protease YdiL (CAAX protease family)
MQLTRTKLLAILEVIVVAFLLIPFLTLGVYRLWPRFESWQTETLGFPFPVFVYVVFIGLPLLIIRLRGKRLAEYGISFRDTKYHLDIAAACFIPVALANLPLGMGVDHTRWGGALLLAAIQIGLLFLLAWMLRKQPSAPGIGLAAAGLLLWLPAAGVADNMVWKAIALFLTYAVFVGFGEEILYRGYMQSRLNEVFGKPYSFFGVAFGWGALITALLFGLTHIGVLRWILGLSTEVTLAWGFWTIFSGLVFGLVREKTGSILAPALLHGLPQAIATVAMLFL